MGSNEKRLTEARSAVNSAIDGLQEAADALEKAVEARTADKDATVDVDALETRFAEAKTELERRNAELARVEAIFEARKATKFELPDSDDEQRGKAGVKVNEPDIYRKGGQHSYFRDLRDAKDGKGQAIDRLTRHSQFEAEKRAINSTDSTGGEFVAPLWLMEDFISLARAARPFADAVNHMPLPPNTDSINFPKVSTGATVAAQADAGAVSSTDAATTSLSVPVITIAGQQDMSRQLFDRSVPGMDQVILADLAAAYATQVDVQCLSGSGSGANAKGVLNASGINAVTYTDASPTLPELYSKLADAVQRIHANRFLPPNAIFMHPVRWGWCLAALDTVNRPLVTPYAPINAQGLNESVQSQGPVGSMMGLPVYTDASIPTNLGSGTNEDRVIVARLQDIWLLEDGEPNQRTYFEVLSGNLQVRVQVFGYMAFTAERYAKAISVISGTGLSTPSF